MGGAELSGGDYAISGGRVIAREDHDRPAPRHFLKYRINVPLMRRAVPELEQMAVRVGGPQGRQIVVRLDDRLEVGDLCRRNTQEKRDYRRLPRLVSDAGLGTCHD